MPKKFFRKYLPDHESIRQNRYLSRFKPLLKHPNLWHLNRRSIAGGVAAGLFAGLIPGPLQMITAAILAIVFRVNLPVAMVSTLYTNPFTWGPLIVAAFAIGSWVTGNGMGVGAIPEFDWRGHSWSTFFPAFGEWLLGLGTTFLIGNLILASSLAVIGYFLVQFAWLLHVRALLRKRRARVKTTKPS